MTRHHVGIKMYKKRKVITYNTLSHGAVTLSLSLSPVVLSLVSHTLTRTYCDMCDGLTFNVNSVKRKVDAAKD